MKHTVMKDVPTAVVEQVICNKCGEDCHKHEHFSTYYVAGYDAEVLTDGDEFGFELCEACLNSFMGTFLHPAKVIDGNW